MFLRKLSFALEHVKSLSLICITTHFVLKAASLILLSFLVKYEPSIYVIPVNSGILLIEDNAK